ncbi:unnamed protein product [Prunus brigantina]
MSTSAKIHRDLHGKSVDQTLYRSMIGSLLYLTASRPDISFSVGVCARFQSDPKESHLFAVKRIIKYVSIEFGLWYTYDTCVNLVVYSDADWAGCSDDRKSTSGGVFYVGNNLVAWHSKKQNSISLSTAEAEYVAAGSCCTQLLWMRQMLEDYGLAQSCFLIYCDNMSAIDISKNPVQHSRTKHIDIRHHFIRDLMEDKILSLEFVPSEKQLADILTKALDFQKHGFRSCPGFYYAKYALASADYSVDLFKSMAYTDQSMPLTSKGLPIKSYLSPFYRFLWDFIRHNVLPTGNNSNPTLAARQLMISMVNHDKIPFGDILYNAILGKTIGHGTKHNETLVFPCLIQRLCERNEVVFHDSDQWHPPIAPYGKASAALSQKVSRTFLTSVSSSSETATLRAQLAAKEEYIQNLLSLIPSSSTPAPAAAAADADTQPAPATVEDSDDSVDSGGSLVF